MVVLETYKCKSYDYYCYLIEHNYYKNDLCSFCPITIIIII